jgi:hypothetical protein
MQSARSRKILDGDEFRAVDLAQQQDAGIDRLVMHAPVPQASERHGAGAAITLGAAFLGAEMPLIEPQVVKKRGARMKT